MSDLDVVAGALGRARSIALLSHVFPEGDCIGAALGAALALEEAGKEAIAYNADPLPQALRGLPGADRIVRCPRLPRAFEALLVVDTSDPGRLGGLLDRIPDSAVVLNVDHHPGNTRFGTWNWVEPAASSAGEMVYRLLRHMGIPISGRVATNLFAAILTDTGSFHFGNTTPASLRAAADLVELGARPEWVAAELYGNRDPGELSLLGELLTTLQLSPDGRLAWVEITHQALARAGIEMGETQGIINYPRSIRGVEIAVAFKEVGPEETRVSLRSSGPVDVARVARAFAGGGHRNAAGCTVRAGMAEARRRVLEAAQQLLDGTLSGSASGGAEGR